MWFLHYLKCLALVDRFQFVLIPLVLIWSFIQLWTLGTRGWNLSSHVSHRIPDLVLLGLNFYKPIFISITPFTQVWWLDSLSCISIALFLLLVAFNVKTLLFLLLCSNVDHDQNKEMKILFRDRYGLYDMYDMG